MNTKNLKKGPEQSASAFSISVGSVVELDIEKLTLGGDGLARKEGLVFFVPFSAPGDTISATVIEVKKNFARAEIKDILKSSPQRQSPPCPVYGKCGGCNWQHISYENQLNAKDLIVREQLKEHLSLKTQLLPIRPSPRKYNYRNRIQLQVEKESFGFFARGSHDLVKIDSCLITDDKINLQLKKALSGKSGKNEISLLSSGEVKLTSEFDPADLQFSQVNTEQNEALVQTVLSWAQESSFEFFYDLYAGAGNFTFPAFKAFPKASIAAVELSSKSVEKAQLRLRELNASPKQISFFMSDVGTFLKRHEIPNNSLVLLDPPRTGCDEFTIKVLGQSKVGRILYVSCNPAALARDIRRLREASPDRKWSVHRVQPFDMFPQTDHIETLIDLRIDTESTDVIVK